MHRVLSLAGSVLILLLLPSAAFAQAFNVDFGTYWGAPPASYGAAAGQAGVWNERGLGALPQMATVDGSMSAVSIQVTAQSAGSWTATSCAPDADPLVGDSIFSNDVGSTWSVTLAGLATGTYTLYLYGPRHPGVDTGAMTVNGTSVDGVSGDSCVFEEGTTHRTVTVEVTDGTIAIGGTTTGLNSGLAGLQLVPAVQAADALPADVPALPPAALAMLAIALGGIALAALRA